MGPLVPHAGTAHTVRAHTGGCVVACSEYLTSVFSSPPHSDLNHNMLSNMGGPWPGCGLAELKLGRNLITRIAALAFEHCPGLTAL